MGIRKASFVALATCSLAVSGIGAILPVAHAADAPPVEQVFAKYRPQHGDVEYDIPDPKTYKQCTVKLVTEGKSSGWVVTGPAGQILRRFMDTNGDGDVDQYSYFRAGLEVYRDIDTNGNARIDQSRWLNLGGTRWGIDNNEDGRIDLWKSISAEEVSRIAVKALVTQDASLLAPLLVTKDDLKELGIKGPLENKLLLSVSDAASKLRKNVNGSKVIHAKTSWLRFDASPPAVIPADSYKTPHDLYVYENVMAIVDSGNPQQPGLVSIGELVRLGDVWKMTMLPQPLEGNLELAAGQIMFHIVGAAPAENSMVSNSQVSKDLQDVIEKEIEPLMKNPPAPNAGKPAFEKYYRQLEVAYVKAVNVSKNDEERRNRTRTLVDTLSAAVQSGNYPSGVARLKQIEGDVTKAAPKAPIVPVIRYRRMLAEYAIAMQDAKSNNDAIQKVHTAWLKDLEAFLDDYPKAEDAPEASQQLAVALEFGGKLDKAKKWYQRIVSDYGDTPAAAKAAGALQRLDLDDKALTLSGTSLAGAGSVDIKQFRSKIVLVIFWDTNSTLFATDLPQIKSLYDDYRAKGFEIVGVNLDVNKETVGPYLEKNKVRWPQIYEPGGLDSPPARSFGIISLPTMFLVDAEGKVTNRNATVVDVKNLLTETYEKK